MNAKELQLVTNEQAIELRKLGFDWPVHYYIYLDYYDLQFDGYADNWNSVYNMKDSDYRCDDGDEDYPYTSVPTVALALKWFRDVHGFITEIGYSKYGKTYEEVESVRLDELIKLLIK